MSPETAAPHIYKRPQTVYVLGASGRLYHIAHTTLAGCTTRCGIVLEKGAEWTSAAPLPEKVCAACAESLKGRKT